MKRTAILSGFRAAAFLAAALLAAACSDDDENPGGAPGTPGEASRPGNTNANPAIIRNATNLEMPRLDEQGGELCRHYVQYKGEEVLNYALEWHKDKKHSRWVAFVFTDITAEKNWNRNNWKGQEWDGRTWDYDPFQPDPDIPEGERSELADFAGSGYNRGHLCASEDRVFSMDANGQTFYLSNMSPQLGGFNQRNWVELEEQVRNWGRNSGFRDTLFVVKGGTIRDDQINKYIGSGRVAVPKYYFMALLCKKYERGQTTYKAIGFWVEHKNYDTTPPLGTWAVSIDELEEKTGIDFFCNLPDAAENAVEASFNMGNWTGLAQN